MPYTLLKNKLIKQLYEQSSLIKKRHACTPLQVNWNIKILSVNYLKNTYLLLGDFLVEKKVILNYKLSEKNFLISLVKEILDYAAQRDFSAFKLSMLITIYLATHLYFKWYYWISPVAVWLYFKEVMIRHTIEVGTYIILQKNNLIF